MEDTAWIWVELDVVSQTPLLLCDDARKLPLTPGKIGLKNLELNCAHDKPNNNVVANTSSPADIENAPIIPKPHCCDKFPYCGGLLLKQPTPDQLIHHVNYRQGCLLFPGQAALHLHIPLSSLCAASLHRRGLYPDIFERCWKNWETCRTSVGV